LQRAEVFPEMSVFAFKFAAMAVIFATAWAGGLLSRRVHASSRRDLLFSLGNALAGGIFLGVALFHMLSDAASIFHALAPQRNFPLAFLLAGVGFMLMLFLEEILLVDMRRGLPAAANKPLYPYVMALVLAVHSLLAGLALGMEGTFWGSLAIFIAIVAHKGSAAFALGITLHRGGISRRRITRTLLLFALATPLGIVLGSLFTRLLAGDTGRFFEAVFDALAAGTFLYISVLDIIKEAFFDHRWRWAKFILVTVGLVLMAVLAVWL